MELDTRVGDLWTFIQLVDIGLFQQASDWFEKHLRSHYRMFHVFVEYANMLLKQGSNAKLVEILDEAEVGSWLDTQNEHPSDVWNLLGLMKALAMVRLNGFTQQELQKAFKFWDYMDKRVCGYDLNTIHTRTIGVYWLIVLPASRSEQVKVPAKYLTPPFGPSQAPRFV